MVLTPIGWSNGITASGVFLFSCLFGLFFIYKSLKRKSRLLFMLGLVYFCAGLVYIGDTLDFITVLVTSENIANPMVYIGLLNWMWFPGAVVPAMYIGAELIVPKQKWIIIIVYLVLGIVFEVFLFLDPTAAITFDIPTDIPPTDLINDNLVFESIPSLIALVFLLSILLFLGIGFLSKGIKSSGDIKKKFFSLSAGAFIYTIGAVFDGLLEPGFYLIFVRAAMILSAFFFYYGLKE
jgi:hypothetical protein